jgi:CheY-like chemotaxis protein/HPt (histidine-containing phosphotransfer) domain-containing protein
MMMPGMDGETLGRAILADETLKATRPLMMTSLGRRGDAQRFKEIGFAAYLVKPVRRSDLFDCLVAVLTGKPAEEARPLATRHGVQEVCHRNARILLVEDNVTNQEVACGILQRSGWHADVSCNGRQALQALETRPYDLVLMDVQMPEMDGYEATRQIRDPQSAVLNHDIPIIALTAHAMAGDAEKCLAGGMSDYLTKPFKPQILAEVVEKWLTQQRHDSAGMPCAELALDGNTTPLEPAQPSPVFNREEFLGRMVDDEDFARAVSAGFLEDLPKQLMALKEQLAQEDLESVWKQAHKMKGSAASVGGEALRDAALKVEQAGKAGDLAALAGRVSELEVQTARLQEALQQWAK